MRNPKSEIRNPKEARNPKAEFEQQCCAEHMEISTVENSEALFWVSDFGLRISFGFRISDFGFWVP